MSQKTRIEKKFIITRVSSISKTNNKIINFELTEEIENYPFDSKEEALKFVENNEEYFWNGAIIQEIELVTFD